MLHPQTDLENCFRKIAKGDELAFSTVFEQFKNKVFAVGMKLLKSEVEAEEVVQEVFTRLWNSRENLADVAKPEAYIFTVAYNAVYQHLKRISRDREALDEVILWMSLKQNTTQDMVAANETSRLIYEAVQQLPSRQRMVYVLSKQKDLSYEEIARRMDISTNTVRNHLAQAMKALRKTVRRHLTLFL